MVLKIKIIVSFYFVLIYFITFKPKLSFRFIPIFPRVLKNKRISLDM